MEKRRYDLCLCSADPDYVERLMSYIHRKPNFLFTVLGFTRPRELLNFLDHTGADLVLLDEKYWADLSPEEQGRLRERCGCLTLLSDRRRSEGEIRSVCRYQSAEQLLREVVEYFEKTVPAEEGDAERTQIDAFYSPDGDCGQTTCALLLGHRLAENEGQSVLYMNLDPLAGGGRQAEAATGKAQMVRENGSVLKGAVRAVRERGMPDSTGPTAVSRHSLSDLLYYRKNHAGGTLLQSLTTSEGSLSVLAPVVNPEDLWNLSAEDLKEVLTEIRDRGIYDTVILDLGRDRNPEQMLSVCRRVFLMERDRERKREPEQERENSRSQVLERRRESERSQETERRRESERSQETERRRESERSQGTERRRESERSRDTDRIWAAERSRLDHFLDYVEQREGAIPENWRRIRPPHISGLEGMRPGTRCPELEAWLEKEWISWDPAEA